MFRGYQVNYGDSKKLRGVSKNESWLDKPGEFKAKLQLFYVALATGLPRLFGTATRRALRSFFFSSVVLACFRHFALNHSTALPEPPATLSAVRAGELPAACLQLYGCMIENVHARAYIDISVHIYLYI